MHSSCLNTHVISLHTSRFQGRRYEGYGCVRLDHNEFLCPLCKALSNTTVPLLELANVEKDSTNNLLTGSAAEDAEEKEEPGALSATDALLNRLIAHDEAFRCHVAQAPAAGTELVSLGPIPETTRLVMGVASCGLCMWLSGQAGPGRQDSRRRHATVPSSCLARALLACRVVRASRLRGIEAVEALVTTVASDFLFASSSRFLSFWPLCASESLALVAGDVRSKHWGWRPGARWAGKAATLFGTSGSAASRTYRPSEPVACLSFHLALSAACPSVQRVPSMHVGAHTGPRHSALSALLRVPGRTAFSLQVWSSALCGRKLVMEASLCPRVPARTEQGLCVAVSVWPGTTWPPCSSPLGSLGYPLW